MSYLPPAETSEEEVKHTLELLHQEHKSLVFDITSVKDVVKLSDTLRQEVETSHKQLSRANEEIKYLIAKLEQLKLTYDVQIKQLQNHFDFLSKEQNRIQDWEKQVTALENKHYVMPADAGHLGAHFNGSL